MEKGINLGDQNWAIETLGDKIEQLWNLDR
jgi:hypothetical protein